MAAAVTIPGIDAVQLRDERIARLQAAMRLHGVEVCLLTNEPNIRYATGASAMPVWTMSTFARCAVVPAEGVPILFEHGNSMHRSRAQAQDVRPMHQVEFFDDAAAEATIWAEETIGAIRELGVSGDRVAVDRITAPTLLALQQAGIIIVDSSPITQEAREIKTPQEVALFHRNGVKERELVAVLSDTMLRGGGEYLATNTVCSGPNTNPWRAEASDRAIEAGDLVYVDTDTVGIGGYFFCVSRSFLCGNVSPTPAQRDLYRAAHEWLVGMLELVRPGLTCAELGAMAPKIPDRFVPQRYEAMIHGVGLEEESPSVCHPQDAQANGDTVIQENMTLVVELYMGEVGAREGVKLGDEILVTAEGSTVLAPYPFSETLLV
jgi:Xaa-Pro aminopeptidase